MLKQIINRVVTVVEQIEHGIGYACRIIQCTAWIDNAVKKAVTKALPHVIAEAGAEHDHRVGMIDQALLILKRLYYSAEFIHNQYIL